MCPPCAPLPCVQPVRACDTFTLGSGCWAPPGVTQCELWVPVRKRCVPPLLWVPIGSSGVRGPLKWGPVSPGAVRCRQCWVEGDCIQSVYAHTPCGSCALPREKAVQGFIPVLCTALGIHGNPVTEQVHVPVYTEKLCRSAVGPR